MKKNLLLIISLLCCLAVSAQWGGENGIQPKPVGTGDYGTEYVVGADGTIWFYYYHPSSMLEDSMYSARYEMCLQAISREGKLLFGDRGKVVSSYTNLSWTQVNQYLHANSDSTVTLVVPDCRNSSLMDQLKTYTAYRFSPDGTSLWGDDGVCLDEGVPTDMACCMTFSELTDGSTAFAWQHNHGTNGQLTCIDIQRVSKDGKCQYKLSDTRLAKALGYYVYPYMVPSDNGSFILVYGYGSSYYLRAMKYNSDGTKAWPSEVKIYSGGWGSVMALQARMRVTPGPDGGVIVTWNDDYLNEGYYAPYLAYIKSDGEPAFVNENGKPDIRLSYEELSAHPPVVNCSPDGKYIYAIFDEFNQNQQNFQQLSVQKLNMNGEMLWGTNGIQLEGLDDHNFSYGSVQNGKEGELMFFYQQFYDYHHVDNLYTIRSAETGQPVDPDKEKVRFRSSGHYRAGLESKLDTGDNTIILYWEEDAEGSGIGSSTNYDVIVKMNLDGTEVGAVDGITEVKGDNDMRGSRIYGIHGRIMSALKKGDIYIQNGKKYVK